ncbi:MAG: ABC transporter permease [Deltaproteobacteria bacterium]|nr:ABC transporter permease [Deltaproteobacteria bacterium]
MVERQARRLAWRSLSVLLLLASWWTLSLFFPPSFVPGPMPVLAKSVEIAQSGEFPFHMAQTVRRVGWGFLLALSFALPAGIAMGSIRAAEDLLEVEVIVGLSIPGLATATLSILLFGLSEMAAYFTIAVTTCPILITNIWSGTKALDRDLVEMSRVFHASVVAKLRRVILPQLVPYLLAASRYGFSIAWKVTVILEMLGFSNGVGYKITEAFQLYSPQGVLGWTIMFTVVIIIFEYGLLNRLERRLTRWRPETEMWRR